MSRASETAYREIRRKVLSGELGPNQQLTERELADLCGVSRTPVRDALRRLEAESLIKRNATQRWFIKSWDANAVEEIFSLRSMIESHAAMRAASRITEDEILELERLNRTILSLLDDGAGGEPQTFVAANDDFHRVILEAARSERLATMRKVLFEPASSTLTSRRYDRQHIQRSHADLEELIFAFRRHDPDWARLAMDNHIHHALMMALRRHQSAAIETADAPVDAVPDDEPGRSDLDDEA